MDLFVTLVGLVAGTFIGLTGMGGGALLTPILVLGFNIPVAVAVSSDVVASLVIKPLGALVHVRKGTVERPLVILLALGSVPGALLGSLVFRHLADGADIGGGLRTLLGWALLLASLSIGLKAWVGKRTAPEAGVPRYKRGFVIVVGLIGGFMVGLTSVGSGSLILAFLMLLYPQLSGSRLVGTDLAQAIPLVAAAAVGHLLFGRVDFGLTASLLLGAIPGVLVGARWSSVAPDTAIRPALVVALLATAVKLLGGSTAALLGCLAGLVVFLVMAARRPSKAHRPGRVPG